ncbi:hypothetical protein BKP37_12635 [Anaerobacillus alkalilacustris]|uniref:DUF4352 domain-containing protein n=1 Tax=Anaerobacillus alkalilacustris TaxID=393763 RepID=A0A1S2LK11_9BACI|nr:hypothetical protein [Anaerobacillus alkalilacustris]OIJ12644.1 hypothetical protein BKP37_12635 [Anaerobacillus alkalilacustris]
MKKRLLFLLAALLLVVSACGTTEEPTETEVENEEGVNQEEEQEEVLPEEVNDDGFEHSVGDVIENEGGKFTLISRASDIETQETGPIIFNISQVNTSTGDLKGDLASFLEKDFINYIQIDMEVENTSEENITFFPAQATITTNTGEQLESDMWLSEHIDGEFIGAVKKSGSQFFILEKSVAEDIEWVRIIIGAPMNADWENVGEKIDFTVNLK